MSEDKDIIIIGAGAAGLTAAQYAARANLNVLLIEEMAPGGQALVINDLENYPGFPEPISGYDFSEKMAVQAKNFGAQILTSTVKKVSKEGPTFVIETAKGEYKSSAVIIATGAKHRALGVKGEKEFTGRGVSYCATCDGPFFRKKKMLVVGGGDAACDESIFLSNLTDKIVHIHRKDRFRAQKSLAERVLKNPGIDVRFNTIVKEIQGDEKVTNVVLEKVDTGETYTEEVDAVFVFIGSIPQTTLFEDLKKDDAGYIITNQRMESSTAGLYVAGDVRSSPFRQIVVAAGEGAVAAHCAAQYIDELKGEGYK